MTPEESLKIRRQLESVLREEAKQDGAYEEKLRLLRKETKEESLEDMEKFLKRLRKELTREEDLLKKENERWERRWKEKLAGN
jgi:hypothetical protein